MRTRRQKSFLEAMVILVAFFIVASWSLNAAYPIFAHSPLDFYGTSKEVSLDEMVEVASKFNLSLYLPSELPNNLELTAIYLKDGPFIAMVVYSAENNKDYKTAEFVIQIAPSESSPTYDSLKSEADKSEYRTALEINGWPVLVDDKADSGGEAEFREKYGDYVLLIWVWIDGMRYNLVAPTLNTNDAIQVVERMSLLTP